MNFHLILDEKFLNIFVEARIGYFKKCDDVFVIFEKKDGNDYKYLTHPIILNNLISLEEFNRQYSYAGNIPSQAKIFVHFLHHNFYESILTLPKTIPVHWIFWGGDFYFPLAQYADRILDPKTIKLYFENTRLSKLLPFPFQLKKNIVTFVGQKKHALNLKRKAIQRADYFLHWNKMDYQLVKDEYKTHMKFLFFRYTSGENAYPKNVLHKGTVTKREIAGVLFGNSAHYTNNHLDGLDILCKKIKPGEAKIYCPLSYGPEYVASVVSKYGSACLGESFIPLLQFMPIDVYWNFLNQNIDIVFMNQRRTQAAGNILRCIYLGKKVYMRKENTLYRMLKENGVQVFSIEDDFQNSSKENILAPLSENNQESNRSYLMDMFPEEKIRETDSILF